MKTCPVCGAASPDDSNKCERCGYKFSVEIFGDDRNNHLQKKIADFSDYKKKMEENIRIYSLYLQSLNIANAEESEFGALITKALFILGIPLRLSIDMELSLSDKEKGLITLICRSVENFEAAHRVSTLPAEAYVKLGNTMYFMGNFEKALSYFNKALLQNPNYDVAHYNKALLMFKTGKYDKALKSLDKIISLTKDEKVKALRELVVQLLRKSSSQ